MPSGLVTIVIPVYNDQQALSECLRSLSSQSLSAIEVIVVDDCSTDDSGTIAERYSIDDPRFRAIRLDQNMGRGKARNTGIDVATGKYIFFVDSDDSLPPLGLETLYTAAEFHQSNLVIGKARSKVDVDSNFVKGDLFNVSLRQFPDLLYSHSVWNKLILREELNRHKIRFDDQRHAEDMLFSLRLNLSFDRITVINKLTYNYSWGRQITRASLQKVLAAQANDIHGLKLVEAYGDPEVLRTMKQKVLRHMYAANVRAVNVLDHQALTSYLKGWSKLVSDLVDDVGTKVPDHVREFATFLANDEIDRAIDYWKKKNMQKKQSFRLLRKAKRILMPPGAR